jgi:hypothetical protein
MGFDEPSAADYAYSTAQDARRENKDLLLRVEALERFAEEMTKCVTELMKDSTDAKARLSVAFPTKDADHGNDK